MLRDRNKGLLTAVIVVSLLTIVACTSDEPNISLSSSTTQPTEGNLITPSPTLTVAATPSPNDTSPCSDVSRPRLSLSYQGQIQHGAINGVSWHSPDCSINAHGFEHYAIPRQPQLIQRDSAGELLPWPPTSLLRASVDRVDLTQAEELETGFLRIPISARGDERIHLEVDGQRGEISFGALTDGYYLVFANANWTQGGIFVIFLIEVGPTAK